MLFAAVEAEWAPSSLGSSEESAQGEEGMLSAAILASQRTAREEEAVRVRLEKQLMEALQASRASADIVVLPAPPDPRCVRSSAGDAASPSALDMTASQLSNLFFPGMEANEEKELSAALADLQACLLERKSGDESMQHLQGEEVPACHGTSSVAGPLNFDMATALSTETVRLDQDIGGDHTQQPDALEVWWTY